MLQLVVAIVVVVIGIPAAVAGTMYCVEYFKNRRARLIVQYWWDIAIDPRRTKRVHSDIAIGLLTTNGLPQNSLSIDEISRWIKQIETRGEDSSSAERTLGKRWIEPQAPLHRSALPEAEVWVLRILVYNPGKRGLSGDDLGTIVVTLTGSPEVTALSWQANDDRFAVQQQQGSGTATSFTLTRSMGLRPKQKVRDDLAVVVQDRRHLPALNVTTSATCDKKIKPFPPSTTRWQFIWGIRRRRRRGPDALVER